MKMIFRTRPRFAMAPAILLAILLAGCGTTGKETAERAADAALAQISIYERDIHAKIKAENDYYDTVVANAAKRISRLRSTEHIAKFESEAAGFAASNAGGQADAMASAIPTFIDSAMQSWAKREAGYEELMQGTVTALQKGRKEVAAEQAKIRKLSNKLRALSESRSTKEMLKLMVAFAKEVKTKLDELQEAADKATDAAAPAANK